MSIIKYLFFNFKMLVIKVSVIEIINNKVIKIKGFLKNGL